jgi:Rieske Fe-S protein
MTHLCRRTLLKGAAATCGAGLLAACGGGDASSAGGTAAPAPPAPAPAAPSAGGAAPGGLRASLATLADVPVGGAVEASAPDGTKVLIAQPKQGEAVAFSAVCPHEGCAVSPDDDHFSCPCHGSQFELDGSLRRGPAERGLTPFPVQVMDGRVLPA